MIKIALVDDHPVTRRGIAMMIESTDEIQIVMEASNGAELLKKISGTCIPEIVLLDISMPVMNGQQTMEKLLLSYPDIKIIVFSFYGEEDMIINMIVNGACGYINKSSDPSVIQKAIVSVHKYGFYLGDLVKKEYFQFREHSNKKTGFYGKSILTKKEVEFIQLASTDLSYKEIAEKMGVSFKTVENYRDSLFQKLDLNSRPVLVLYGVLNGMIAFYH